MRQKLYLFPFFFVFSCEPSTSNASTPKTEEWVILDQDGQSRTVLSSSLEPVNDVRKTTDLLGKNGVGGPGGAIVPRSHLGNQSVVSASVSSSTSSSGSGAVPSPELVNDSSAPRVNQNQQRKRVPGGPLILSSHFFDNSDEGSGSSASPSNSGGAKVLSPFNIGSDSDLGLFTSDDEGGEPSQPPKSSDEDSPKINLRDLIPTVARAPQIRPKEEMRTFRKQRKQKRRSAKSQEEHKENTPQQQKVRKKKPAKRIVAPQRSNRPNPTLHTFAMLGGAGALLLLMHCVFGSKQTKPT